MPDHVQSGWIAISGDLLARTAADGAVCTCVDDCVKYIFDTCQLELGVTCSRDLAMNMFAHLSPHVMPPCKIRCVGFLMCDKMVDLLGPSAALYLRGKLVRSILRIPGLPAEPSADALLQDRCDAKLLSVVMVP